MFKFLSLLAISIALPTLLATQASAQRRPQTFSIVVTVTDELGRAVRGAPVNIYPLTTAGGVTYTPAVYVRPIFTTERGVAVFNETPGQYQIEVGKTGRHTAAVCTVRLWNRNEFV